MRIPVPDALKGTAPAHPQLEIGRVLIRGETVLFRNRIRTRHGHSQWHALFSPGAIIPRAHVRQGHAAVTNAFCNTITALTLFLLTISHSSRLGIH